MVKQSNENYFAFIIVLLISIVYLFPAFLGKVDTPFDIRNSRMYPWAYYAVDKKTSITTLWKEEKGSLSSEQLRFKIKLNEEKSHNPSKLSSSKYLISFQFKSPDWEKKKLDLDIRLINDLTGGYYKAPVEFIASGDGIYKGYLQLNNLLKELTGLSDLNDYSVVLKTINKNKNTFSLFQLQEMKLIYLDFSKALKAHCPFNEDLIQGFTPNREYYSESLKKGKIPFWNNYILTGFELFAEPQMGYLHPVFLLAYLIFEHFTAHIVITFIFLFLCGFGGYLVARYWGMNFAPALLTAIVYMFHPFNSVWFSFEHILMCSGTLPFLLLAYEKNIKEERILNKYLLISALLAGLIFLSGHLQTVYYTLIFFFLFAVFRFVQEMLLIRKNYLKHFVSIGVIFSAGLMISSIVLVPFLSYLSNSHRVAIPDYRVKATSVPLKAFFGVIYPFKNDSFNNNYVYLGLLPFLLSLFSFKEIKKNTLVVFLYLTIIISVLICTGSPLFFLIKDYIPGFKQLQHYRFLMLYSLSVPFLAGFGFQYFLNHISFVKEKIKLLLIILIILCSSIDLMFHSTTFVTWAERKDYKPIHKNGVLEFLKKEQKRSKEPFRILSVTQEKIGERFVGLNIAVPNTLLPYRIEDATGYSSLISKDLYSLFLFAQTHNSDLLYDKQMRGIFININIPYPISNYKSMIVDLLNVKYFLTPNVINLQDGKVKKVFSEDCDVYENKNVLPRAFVVPKYKVIKDPKETIVTLDSEGFNPREEVVFMNDPHVNEPLHNDKLEYKVDFLKYDQDNITLKVKVNQAGFLVLGNDLDFNWRVRVNKKEGNHIQANLVQRAIYLPGAGKYIVEFYYFPKLFLISLGITSLAVLILIALSIYLVFRKRESVS